MRLLLRADAEQCWLHREVIPVLRHLETRERLPEEEVGAALAYLEAMWNEAMVRARETDAAHAHLRGAEQQSHTLSGTAGRYHAAVRVLRGIVAERVSPLVECSRVQPEDRQAQAANGGVRVKDARADGLCPKTGGWTPRAA